MIRKTQPAEPAALLIVDMFNHFDFPGGDSLAKSSVVIGKRILAMRKRFDDAGRPVIYCNDNWMDWRSDYDELLAACQMTGGASALLAERLKPLDHHYRILKPKQSAFTASPLRVLLDQIGVTHLAITGVATDSCVTATAIEANMLEYRIWIPSDCTAANTPERKRNALQLLRANTRAITKPCSRIAEIFPKSAN